MSDHDVPITQAGDPPPEPESETEALLLETAADGDAVPDTSEDLPQNHQPLEGAPA